MNIDIKTFLSSNLFLGVPSFEKEKLWHGFLYMTESKLDKGIKIGFTNYDLRRRDKELKEFKSPRYMWSSPNPQLLEKYVKQILVRFTKPSNNKYSDEVFYNIPIEVLVQTVRLIILYVVTKEQWISGKSYYEKLYKYFGGPPFNSIVYDSEFETSGSKEEEVDENSYVIGTRVQALWDGKSYEGKINGEYIPELLDSKTEESLGGGYNILFESEEGDTQYDIPLSRIELLFEKTDVKRIFDLKQAYRDCGIEIEYLKF
jgi:hypothetical protein